MQRVQRVRPRRAGVLGTHSRVTLEDVVDGMNTGFYIADNNGNISFANQSFARMLRYPSRESILGVNLADKVYEKKEARQEFLNKLAEKGHLSDYEISMVRSDGTKVVVSVKSSFISDEAGSPIGVKGIVEEVPADKASKKAKVREVPDMAPVDENAVRSFDSLIKDQLTGLYNYQYFMTALDSEIKRVEHVFRPLCMMMIDLDNFSQYNDKFGREAGDELLKKVSGVLKANLRPTDIICRQAQDQFLAVLPETKRDEALALAKTLKDATQKAMADTTITCSIGMSRFILGMSQQEFFLQANLGLYMAKEAGKNEACLYG